MGYQRTGTLKGKRALLDLIKKEVAPRETGLCCRRKKTENGRTYTVGMVEECRRSNSKSNLSRIEYLRFIRLPFYIGKPPKQPKYEWIPETDVTACYLRLLKTMVVNDEGHISQLMQQKLLKILTRLMYVVLLSMYCVLKQRGQKAVSYILAALKDSNREYRVNALRLSETLLMKPYANLAKTLKAKNNKKVKADILNWFGTNHVVSQIDAVITNMDSDDEGLPLLPLLLPERLAAIQHWKL